MERLLDRHLILFLNKFVERIDVIDVLLAATKIVFYISFLAISI